MGDIYAKLINQYKIKYQVTFLLLNNKHREKGEITNRIQLPVTLSMTDNLTHSEMKKINTQWTLENRIQTIEIKESGWTFKEITQ